MKASRNATKPARTTAAAKKTSTGSATPKKTSSNAAKKSPAPAGAAKKTPLTSPRITAAASKAKRVLTEPAKTPAPKKTPKKVAVTKSPTVLAPAAAAPPKAPAPRANPAPAPAPKPQATPTTIEAFIDVGFGNRLTLRGEGPGLSWEKGITMNCLGSAEWVITIEDVSTPLTFKFLLNDEQWSLGENYTLAPGKTGAFTPYFG